MPATKKTTRRTTSRSLRSAVKPSSEMEINSLETPQPQRSGLGRKLFVGLIVLLLLGFLFYQNRAMFLAARVNGWPITRFELNDKLVARYGTGVLDDLVDEQIIRQEAGKKGIKVTKDEITAKVEEVRKQVGEGVNLEDFLKERGYTLTEFKKQIEVQVLVEKLTAGAVNISDQEVQEFIDQNKANMTASDEAGLKAEALNFLTSRKKNETVQSWFADLKTKAKVTKYL